MHGHAAEGSGCGLDDLLHLLKRVQMLLQAYKTRSHCVYIDMGSADSAPGLSVGGEVVERAGVGL